MERLDILSYRDKHADLFDEGGSLVGGWNDNGIVSLDVTRKFADEEEALQFGREQGQKAIYDAKNGRDIPTGLSDEESAAIKSSLRGEEPAVDGGGVYRHMDRTQLLEAANLALDQGDELGWTRDHYLDLIEGIEDHLYDTLGVDSMDEALQVVEGLPDISPEVALFNRWEALQRKIQDPDNRMGRIDDASSGAADTRAMRSDSDSDNRTKDSGSELLAARHRSSRK